MSRRIECEVCERRVEHREELVVAGRTFSTFHHACYFGREGRAHRLRLGYPLNGAAFWMFFLGFNALAAVGALILGPSPELARVTVIANAVTLFLRLVTWANFEARLPAAGLGAAKWEERYAKNDAT